MTLIERAKTRFSRLQMSYILFSTENLGEEQKNKFSLFVMRPFIFSEALGFVLLSRYVNPTLGPAYFERPGRINAQKTF